MGEKEVLQDLRGLMCNDYVYLDALKCNCLIDLGSQVTYICETFYKTHLFHQDLQPIKNLLETEGAGGQT